MEMQMNNEIDTDKYNNVIYIYIYIIYITQSRCM